MLTAEDALAPVVVPRLKAAGASLERTRFASIDRDGLRTNLILPDDVPALRSLVLEHRAKLVTIDPLTAHLSPAINSWKDQQVRTALAPLQRVAEDAGAAVVVVAHLNKGQGSDPLQRLGGSVGIPAAARSVLLLARDPDDEEGGSRRVLAHVKSNLGEPAPSLALEIEASEQEAIVDVPRIRLVGRSRYAGWELLAQEPGRRSAKLETAVSFLENALSEGARPAAALFEQAVAVGISETTLKRAKKVLGLLSDKSGFDGGWVWELPASPTSTAEQAT
jgi:hypothetical protein